MANIKMIKRTLNNFKALLISKCCELEFIDDDENQQNPLEEVGIAFQFINEIHLHYLHPTLDAVMKRDDDDDKTSPTARMQAIAAEYASQMMAVLISVEESNAGLLTLPFIYAYMQYQHSMVGIKPYLEQLLNEKRTPTAESNGLKSPRLFALGSPGAPAGALQKGGKGDVLTSVALTAYRQAWPAFTNEDGFDYVDGQDCVDILMMLLADRKHLSQNLPIIRHCVEMMNKNKIVINEQEYRKIICTSDMNFGYLRPKSLIDEDDSKTTKAIADVMDVMDGISGYHLADIQPKEIVKAYLHDIKFWYKQNNNTLNKMMAVLSQDDKAELFVHFIDTAKGAVDPVSTGMLWQIILNHYPQFQPSGAMMAAILNACCHIESIGDIIKAHFAPMVKALLVEDRTPGMLDLTENAETFLATLRTKAAGNTVTPFLRATQKQHGRIGQQFMVVTGTDNEQSLFFRQFYQNKESLTALVNIGVPRVNDRVADEQPELLVNAFGAASALLFLHQHGLLTNQRMTVYAAHCDDNAEMNKLIDAPVRLVNAIASNQELSDLFVKHLSLENLYILAARPEVHNNFITNILFAKCEIEFSHASVSEHQIDHLNNFLQSTPSAYFIVNEVQHKALICHIRLETFQALCAYDTGASVKQTEQALALVSDKHSPWRRADETALSTLLTSNNIANPTVLTYFTTTMLNDQLKPGKSPLDFAHIKQFWTATLTQCVSETQRVAILRGLTQMRVQLETQSAVSLKGKLTGKAPMKTQAILSLIDSILMPSRVTKHAVAIITTAEVDDLALIDTILSYCKSDDTTDFSEIINDCWEQLLIKYHGSNDINERSNIKTILHHLTQHTILDNEEQLVSFISLHPSIPSDIYRSLCQCSLSVASLEELLVAATDDNDEDGLSKAAMQLLREATTPPADGWFAYASEKITTAAKGDRELPRTLALFYYRTLVNCAENTVETQCVAEISLKEMQQFQSLGTLPELPKSDELQPAVAFFQQGPPYSCEDGDTIYVHHAWYQAASTIRDCTQQACQLARRSGAVILSYADTIPPTGILFFYGLNLDRIEMCFTDDELQQVLASVATYEKSLLSSTCADMSSSDSEELPTADMADADDTMQLARSVGSVVI